MVMNKKTKWTIWKTSWVIIICYIWCRSEAWNFRWISLILWSDAFVTNMDGGFDGSRWLTLYTCDVCFDMFWIIIIIINTLLGVFVILKFLVSCFMRFVLMNLTNFNFHILPTQYMSNSLSIIDSSETCITQ